MFNKISIFLLAGVLFSLESNGQGISGYLLDEENNPIPFANVYIKQISDGTFTDSKGRYFMSLNNGLYDVVFSSVGYETKTIEVLIGDKKVVQKNVWLKSSNVELNEVVVNAKRKDPAYEIIQKVIENKEKYLTQVASSRSQVYIKATEIIKNNQRDPIVTVETGGSDPLADPFENNAKMSKDKPDINMLEMNLTLNYQSPDKYKEERSAVKSYGTKDGLYIPNFSEVDFNFYRNRVEMTGLAEAPIISPISRTSILSYKYRLESIDTLEKNIVYKIKVIPRKKGNSTCQGYLYINDEIWNINKLDLEFYKGGLRLYDQLQLKQEYKQINDTLWIPSRQELIYESKKGKKKTFKGTTLFSYSDFETNYPFPEKFFGNEVATTTEQAYKKDSTYWNSSRPVPLTIDQQEMVHYRDSVYAAENTAEYKDSIEAKYNKVSLGELALHGFGFRNYRKKKQVFFSSLTGTLGFEVVAGFRFGPYAFYYKRWESGRSVSASGGFSLGVKNADLQGNARTSFVYDPMKLGTISMNGGRSFYSINPNDAYLNQLKRSNYILNDHFGMNHSIELFNGFYVDTGFNYANRQPIDGLESSTFLTGVIKDDEPSGFVGYSALTTNVKLSYTPEQRYMTEPNRKIVLGSKHPTFSLFHKKGWNGPFSSDIDFDYLEFNIRQKFTIGVLGNSEYSLQTGKFLNTKDLKLVDQKRFRQSDPYLYSNPLASFQLLDTALVATQPYFEAHHIHHFNGALVNNIPLIKKLRLRVVAGAGLLWVKESNYRHSEAFAGVERVFKFGARRRLRIGVYGVAAQSNHSKPKTDFKISFDLIDTWKRDWSY